MISVLILAGVIVAILYFAVTGQASETDGECMQNVYTYDELVQLAQDAGFGSDSSTAAAVAMAESGGNRMAYNPETAAETPEGHGSFGLWQIYLHKHPEFNCEDLYQPDVNARAAFQVYQRAGGFSPWSTFKSGRYQEFLA